MLTFNCVGLAVPDKTVREYWAVQQRFLPHTNQCLESAQNGFVFELENSDYILGAAHNLGLLYSDQGKIKKTEKMYLRALAEYEKI